jgi:hypothetical protein
MKMCVCVCVCVGVGRGNFHALMTSELDGIEWPAAHLGDFVSGEQGPLN